jgi:hypothetical protein
MPRNRDSVEQFPSIYRRKFVSHHFDVIVATDNNGFDSFARTETACFPARRWCSAA